jgi:hypothetical protein
MKRSSNDMMRITERFHEIAGLDVSWVGECPWTNKLCFGGEDGRLSFVSEHENPRGSSLLSIRPASDSINAVAFAGESIAVSSRNEVLIGKRASSADPRPNFLPHSFVGGAYGIEASYTGAFLAPIGDQGLLILDYDDSQVNAQIAWHQDAPLNFYRLVRLADGPDGEVFAAATRRGGLFVGNFANGILSAPMIQHHFKGHDIVDVCSLNDPRYPLAAACVSRNRAIFLIRDALGCERPVTLNYGGLDGTAYTLLCAQGHLMLLTDEELIALPDVASRFLRDESLDRPLRVVSSPVNAAEAFLLNDHSVLLIQEDSTVAEIRVAEMVGQLAEKTTGAESASNGHAGQERFIDVISETKSPEAVESGWQRENQFELTRIPA